MFESFPYTNYHNLNLDWILKRFHEYEETLKNFVSLNTIKYADPFDWDITTQYGTNTIVMDPATGVAYISVQPVPAGAAITDTDYWTPVFDLSLLFEGIKDAVAAVVEESTTATVSSPAGTWVWVGNTLYRTTTAVTAGDTYRPGGNVVQITVEEMIKGLQSEIDAEETARIAADNELSNDISDLSGDITDLRTDLQNAKFPHWHATDHINIYVDCNSGNDTNDGSTEHPIKTLKRAWEMMANQAAGVYIFLVGSGTYDMYYPVFSSCMVHLAAAAQDVIVNWGSENGTQRTLCLYDSYFHINGYQPDPTNNPDLWYDLTLNLLHNPTSVSHHMYLEGGKLFMRHVTIRGSHRRTIGVVGGYGQFEDCRFELPFRVSSSNCVFGGCTFVPQPTNILESSAIHAYNGAEVTITSGAYFISPTTAGNIKQMIYLSASNMYLRNTPTFTNSENSDIDLIYAIDSNIYGTQTRLISWLRHSCKITESMVNGQYIPNIYPESGSYRYDNYYNFPGPIVIKNIARSNGAVKFRMASSVGSYIIAGRDASCTGIFGVFYPIADVWDISSKAVATLPANLTITKEANSPEFTITYTGGLSCQLVVIGASLATRLE